MNQETTSLTSALHAQIAQAIADAGGWLGFDTFMQHALYHPGLGYYASARTKLGTMPADGSDFVTAPQLSPAFGAALARQVAQALQASGTDEVWEFGAGSGALAAQLLHALKALGQPLRRYTIVDISADLRQRQQTLLQPWADTVTWATQLPPAIEGVVIGNEVLDAMPVQLLARQQGHWYERGVILEANGQFGWADRPTTLRPPCEIEGEHDYLTEIHPQAEGFVRTLGATLRRGLALLIDYGFPESEYYHPQRHMGTLVCHRAHQVDMQPLHDVGDKDLTAHVNFTAIALAAQDAGLEVLGYTSQARFLMNCGVLSEMEQMTHAQRALASKLILEHEMGELFKVLAIGPGPAWQPLGFAQGDRLHRL